MQRAALLAVLAAALHTGAQAACQSGLAERLHDKIDPQRVLIHELTVCHAWHGHLGRSVVVLPTRGTAPGTLDLDILVVQQPDNGNSERSTIVARQRQTVPSSRGSDAMAVSDIEFDAARYRLHAQWQSFGLRIHRRSMATSQPASSETLSLYGLDRGNQLHLLLDEFETRRERGRWGPGCTGHFKKQERQLAVVHSASSGAKGMADLQVRQTETSSVNELQGNDCVESSELPRFSESTLRYDGRQYRAVD